MGSFSAWHWILVGVVVMLLFGRGKISEFMGDAAKGIKAFKKGMAEDDPKPETAAAPAAPEARTIDHAPVETASASAPAPATPAQTPKAS
ncbi:MAG: twin-arginine translocase TatA/TatE family subunit [Rhizobiales bacterium]|nr:twin-arginine translocase TatA/TatE family subunit [Hyphomicrobiales bacterium]